MTEEVSATSPLMKQARNAGYYAALVFGAGYLLTFIGIIVVAIEVLIRTLPYIGPYISTIPPWLIAGLICYLIAVIFGAILGGSIIRNAKSARDFGTSLNTISSSVSAFSCMILFAGIGSIILVSGISSISYPYGYYPSLGYYPTVGSFYLTYPIIEVVGAILLLIGFRAYRGKQTDSKLVGAILMLVSVILIYIVAYIPLRDAYAAYSSILGMVPYGTSISLVSLPPLPGILLSEATLETVTLMMASICALLFAFFTQEGEAKRSVVGVILSVGGILFAVGLLYFNFSTVSLLSKLLPYTGSMMATLWIIFFGFLVLGISGIIVLIAASLFIAVSVKQLSAQPPKPSVPPPPPPPPST